MIMTIISIVVLIALVAGVIGLIYWRRRPRELKPAYFQEQWHELQVLLKDKAQWTTALQTADALLDEALKKKHISGKNMGERLVKAQRMLTDNDGVWFGHKLRGQLEHDATKKLKDADIKEALLGIRQALMDLGALPGVKAAAKPLTPPKAEKTEKPTAAPKPATPKPTPRTTSSSPKRIIRRRKI